MHSSRRGPAFGTPAVATCSLLRDRLVVPMEVILVGSVSGARGIETDTRHRLGRHTSNRERGLEHGRPDKRKGAQGMQALA
jgi:hypothetical protein